MGLVSFFRNVYDLDTLDTRFTTPSTVPYKTVAGARDDPNRDDALRKPAPGAQPSKWRTPEFICYYIFLSGVIPYMFWTAYDVSRPSDPRYVKYEHLLTDGWIPGRKIDISDAQYDNFRSNIPYTVALIILHPLCRRLWNAVSANPSRLGFAKPTSRDAAEARMQQRVSFDFGFALVFLAILHGFSAVKVLLILYVNYKMAKGLPRAYLPVATWVFNVGILFANEFSDGYKFQWMAMLVSGRQPTDIVSDKGWLVEFGAWLDHHGGLNSRWEILFNFTILRLISFNLDYYWSLDQQKSASLEVTILVIFPSSELPADAHKKRQLDPAHLSERDRVSIPAPAKDFVFRNYIAYAIYAPLYLTGPIVTFNDYMAQARHRPATIETARTVRYGVRFLLVLLSMEVLLHYDYVGAISQAVPVWSSYTAAQLSLLSYFNLHIIWLKLLIPWRFFRLWALLDGVDPPENMVRCVSDNYSTVLFWRAWHRSYNRWLVRYMWIPLGGADFRTAVAAVRSVAGYVLVFTFVALWHDIQMRLLLWGWLIVFFMLPEFAGRFFFPPRKWEGRPTAYRMLSSVGAVVNILLMMMANMVGFAVGLDGLQTILSSIFHDYSGLVFLTGSCVAFFVGVQVMFEMREAELRRGIVMRC